MTKDVLLSISGLHFNGAVGEEETEPIEVITPASYYFRNGKHYILYEELVEGMTGTIHNTVKIQGESMLEIIKSGLTSARMVFEKDKLNLTQYETPYGALLIGIYTRKMKVSAQEDEMDVYVQYTLDINDEKVADCDIKMNIKSRTRTEE